MARHSKKASTSRKSGAIRTKSPRSEYAAREEVPRDPAIEANIDEWVRYGEALRSDIEQRIDEGRTAE